MSTKAKAKSTTTKTKKENLETLPLPELWERFKAATGESTKSPNKRFLVRRIEEALAAEAKRTEGPPPAKLDKGAREPRRRRRSPRRPPQATPRSLRADGSRR